MTSRVAADLRPHRPRRILVTGCSVSGKSTPSAALATTESWVVE
jgi:adenylylsulfate kinase-like enzyme